MACDRFVVQWVLRNPVQTIRNSLNEARQLFPSPEMQLNNFNLIAEIFVRPHSYAKNVTIVSATQCFKPKILIGFSPNKLIQLKEFQDFRLPPVRVSLCFKSMIQRIFGPTDFPIFSPSRLLSHISSNFALPPQAPPRMAREGLSGDPITILVALGVVVASGIGWCPGYPPRDP